MTPTGKDSSGNHENAEDRESLSPPTHPEEGGDASGGECPDVQEWVPAIYGELRAIAHHYLGKGEGLTIQPTVLVHEAYLRLARRGTVDEESKTHFFAVAAKAVRHTLRDHIRSRGRIKRGGAHHQITLSGLEATPQAATVDFSALDLALTRFREIDPRAAQVVDLRYFAGLTELQIADVLGVSERTVRNDWAMARAWLLAAIKDGDRTA